ncbi:MAG: LemA family protein [Micrococcales bacterium]|nr:LemA family protein [Micrococcales bacterium]
MSPLVIVVTVVVAVIALALVAAASGYNGLVRRRNAVDNAWAQIDVQLKRRHDLIPNLVSAVKGYLTHERATLEAVTWARSAAMGASGPQDRCQAEDMLSGALKNLFAVSEAYPDLRASANFLQLQDELAASENRIAYSRQYYNDAVMAYNNATQTIPTSIIASIGNFQTRQLYGVTEAERGPVQVTF